MKKIIMLLIVAALMLGVSGQAMASFNQGDLIRVVYSGTGSGTEYATDLGAFSATNSNFTAINDTTDTFSASTVGASSWSNVNVAYFIDNNTANGGNGAAYTSGAAITGGMPNYGAYFSNFDGAASVTLQGYAAAAGSSNNATLLQSNASSYWTNLNTGGTTVGLMANYLQTTAEASLAALSTTGYVSQVLYYYGSTPDATSAQGTAIGVLTTYANGSTTLSPMTATPIPAAIYLFGSGLLGLIGIRRKTVV